MRWETPPGVGEAAVLETVLREISPECHSLLDVGCFDGRYVGWIMQRRPDLLDVWGLDAYAPALARVPIAPARRIHAEIPAVFEARELPVVDAVICLDVLEHLAPYNLGDAIRGLKQQARRVVVVFTPCGFIEQDGHATEAEWPGSAHWMRHRSGITPESLEAKGFECFGWKGFDYGRVVGDALWGVWRRT